MAVPALRIPMGLNMDEFQKNINSAKSATSDMTQFAVKKFVDLNSSMIATAGTAGKVVVGIREVQRALLPIAASVLVVVEAFRLMNYMTELAKERIEEYAAIVEKAGKAGLSEDAFQRLTKSGEQLKLTVDQVNDALDRFAEKSKDKLGGSDLQKRVTDLVGYGNFAGNTGVAGVTNAVGTNDKLRAAVDLITQALDKGERLAALDLAEKVFGRDIADRLRANSTFLREMVDTADKMSATKIISEEEVARALDLKNRMEEAEKILSEKWKPIQDDLARLGMNYHESWVNIVQDLAQAVDYATKFYQALKQVPDWFANRIGNASVWKSISDASGALGLNSDPASMGIVMRGQPGFDSSSPDSPAGRALAAGLRNRTAMQRAMQDAIDVQSKVRGDTSKPPPASNKEDNSRDQFETAIDQLTRRTAMIKADTAAVFQNNAARAGLRAEFQLLTSIMRDGGEVTQKQIDDYERLRQTMSAQQALEAAGIQLTGEHAKKFIETSESIKTATTAYDAAREKLSQLNTASSQLGSGLSTAFGDAVLEAKNLGEVVNNLLKSLARAGINSLFGTIFNAPSSGGLSPFASWASGLIPKFADGGVIPPNGLAIVSEHAPGGGRLVRAGNEPIMVTPNDIQPARGGNSMSVTYQIDASGADPAAISRLERVLNSHSRAIASQQRATISSQRYQLTGVS